MIRLALIIFVLSPSLLFTSAEGCACKPLPLDAKTKTGWETVTIKENKSLKIVRGIVTDASGSALTGAYVEVFKIGQNMENEDNAMANSRVAGCELEADGKFAFPQLPPGKYQVIFSQEGFNTIYLLVEVSLRGASKKLQIQMNVSN